MRKLDVELEECYNFKKHFRILKVTSFLASELFHPSLFDIQILHSGLNWLVTDLMFSKNQYQQGTIPSLVMLLIQANKICVIFYLGLNRRILNSHIWSRERHKPQYFLVSFRILSLVLLWTTGEICDLWLFLKYAMPYSHSLFGSK